MAVPVTTYAQACRQVSSTHRDSMKTSRFLQIAALLDRCESQDRVLELGAKNLLRIGNFKGAEHQQARAVRYRRVADICRHRLGPTGNQLDENKPPECALVCKWRQEYRSLTPQVNALRIELPSMVAAHRCGWRLKPNVIGGHPLDYEPCTFI